MLLASMAGKKAQYKRCQGTKLAYICGLVWIVDKQQKKVDQIISSLIVPSFAPIGKQNSAHGLMFFIPKHPSTTFAQIGSIGTFLGGLATLYWCYWWALFGRVGKKRMLDCSSTSIISFVNKQFNLSKTDLFIANKMRLQILGLFGPGSKGFLQCSRISTTGNDGCCWVSLAWHVNLIHRLFYTSLTPFLLVSWLLCSSNYSTFCCNQNSGAVTE